MSVAVKWVGHSTFEVCTDAGITVVVDPWYRDSPVVGDQLPTKVDFVLISHDHWDHVKDVAALVEYGAKVVAQPETVERLSTVEGIPKESFLTMNVGGTLSLTTGVTATMIKAFHTSRSGVPAGFILGVEGFTIAHLGDTDIYGDLQLYGQIHNIDLALIPAGDRFTMGPATAATAAALLKSKFATPMHYLTFPQLVQTPEPFVAALERVAPGIYPWIPSVGETRLF